MNCSGERRRVPMLRNFLSSDQDSPQLRSFRRPISLLPNMAPVDGAVFQLPISGNLTSRYQGCVLRTVGVAVG